MIYPKEPATIAAPYFKYTFDIATFSKGIYFVELSDESSRSVQRLMLDK